MIIMLYFRWFQGLFPIITYLSPPALDHLSASGKGAFNCLSSVEHNYCTGSKEQPASEWKWSQL